MMPTLTDGEIRIAVDYTDHPGPSALEAALSYAALGWRVLPCEPNGKRPLGRLVPRGLHDATTDEATIRRWWAECPTANVAIEATGLVVIDVDVAAGKRGDRALAELVRDHGPLGWSLSATTPRGGIHHYFRAPAGARFKNAVEELGAGLDVRAAGSYCLAAGSTVGGGIYRWMTDGAVLSEPADWLVELLPDREPERPAAPSFAGEWDRRTLSSVERCLRYVDKMPPAISGSGGHAAFFRVACVAVRGFSLPDDAAIEVLRYFSAHRSEPPWSEREIHHKLVQAKRARDFAPGYLVEATR
jgi:hypothetical protein